MRNIFSTRASRLCRQTPIVWSNPSSRNERPPVPNRNSCVDSCAARRKTLCRHWSALPNSAWHTMRTRTWKIIAGGGEVGGAELAPSGGALLHKRAPVASCIAQIGFRLPKIGLKNCTLVRLGLVTTPVGIPGPLSNCKSVSPRSWTNVAGQREADQTQFHSQARVGL